MLRKKTIQDLAPDQLVGSTVLLRADLNVPLSEGTVQDDTRLEATLPTLHHLIEAGARVMVLSHLGRPGGTPTPGLSLAPVAERLGLLLGREVSFSADVRGPGLREARDALGTGGVLVVENTRFDPGERANDKALATEWADLCDLYVDDAFGSAHRAHASTEAVARILSDRGGESVAGLLMEKELRFLDRSLAQPESPFVAILGGAKISGKIDVVEALLGRVDRLLIGGAMANTFFLALGLQVGESLVEENRVEMAKALLEKAGDRLLLPVDTIVADRIAPDVETRAAARTDVQSGDCIGDIGPQTRALFASEIRSARTIVWNGPMGVFEMEPFAAGTFEIADAVASASDTGALSILGGGDSAAAAEASGLTQRFSHVSTGGGASLELLAGKRLPGVDILTDMED